MTLLHVQCTPILKNGPITFGKEGYHAFIVDILVTIEWVIKGYISV